MMVDAISIAVSGLNAASVRAQAAATNIANTGVKNYVPVDVVQTASPSGGTSARLQPKNTETYTNTGATSGATLAPVTTTTDNVNISEDVLNLKQAAIAYKASLAVVTTASSMSNALLNSFDHYA